MFTLQIHHNGEFISPPIRRYRFGDIDWFDFVHCDMFSMNILEEIFKDLGYIDGRILFTHFRIPRESFDVGLLPLMFDKGVIRFLKCVPRCKEVEVYIETGVSLIERHVMERMTSKSKGVVIIEIVDHDVNGVVGKEFNDVNWKDDPHHLVDEPGEISDMFDKLDQALDELDQVIEDEDVTHLFANYDQVINDERVAKEMVAEEAVDGDDGEQVVSNGLVILDELYDTIVAQEEGFLVDDGDVIPDEVVAEVVAQKGVRPVDDGDVIPDEVVGKEMLEDQTRSIKRRRGMAYKENEDDAQ
nr:hypothetical protein [Tanacetum cinerariifolium]